MGLKLKKLAKIGAGLAGGPAGWAALGADALGGYLGGKATKKGSKAQQQAAAAQLALGRQGYYTSLGMNDPYYVTGTGANNLQAQMWGLPYQDVRSGLDIAKAYDTGSGAGASFKAKDIVKMLRSGMSVADVAKMGTLKAGKTAKRVSYLAKSGLSPDQIRMLQQGPEGAVPTPEMRNAPNAPQAGAPTPNFDLFYKTPGYQFTYDQAIGAVDNSAAARGGLLSGNNMRELANVGGGIGAQQFWNTQNFLSDLANRGMDAAGQNQRAGQFYTSGGANAIGAAGEAKAAGILGEAASYNDALSSMGNMIGARQSGVGGIDPKKKKYLGGNQYGVG